MPTYVRATNVAVLVVVGSAPAQAGEMIDCMKTILSILLTAASAQGQQYVISTIAGGPAIPTPIAATSPSIGEPAWVAVGPGGDAYFTSGGSTVYKVDTRGILTRVAGTARTGDSGPSTNAPIGNLNGVAADAAGNLYIADAGNYRVRKLSTNGGVVTVAGTGAPGYSGDNGPAVEAQLGSIAGVAVDASGNLYIADTDNNRIRKVAPGGLITTIAGNGSAGYSGDGGSAASARLSSPSGLAADAGGNLYIGDSNNHRVRKVSSDGIITSISGNGLAGYTAEGGPSTTAQLNKPSGMAVDLAGNLYLADRFNYRIRKITTGGSIITIAGNGYRGYSVNGGAAAGAQLDQPRGLAMDAAGNLYIADGNNCRIRKVATNGIITTVAGNGTPGYSGDGGQATNAQLAYQLGVAVSASGELYIADSYNHRVRKVSVNGTITTVAGTGTPGYSGDGGPAISAQINNINGVAVDADGNLYISDYGNYRIRKVSANGIITTFAGTGAQGYSGDRGPAVSAQISTLWGLALDAGGNLFVADYLNHRIRKVAANGIITTVAGTGLYGSLGDGGPATSANLAYPTGVAVDTAGNLYLVDGDNYSIRKVSTDGVITTIAGTGSAGYSGDGGRAMSAQLGAIWGIVADPAGNVYVADSGNNAIRVLKPSATLLSVRTVANAASNLTGAIAPGEIVTAFGSGLGPAVLTQARLDVNGRYGSSLATTRVLFNGTPGPILYTWSTQVSVIVPYGLSGNTASIQMEYQGVKSDPISIPIAPTAPAIFTLDSSGKGQAAALNENGALNTASAPAKAGSIVVFYATGEGQTSPGGVDGQLATETYPSPVQRVDVTIDGQSAEVLYAGAAPGIVAGLMQINARIPANARVGAVPVVLKVGSASSPVGVTVAVSGN